MKKHTKVYTQFFGIGEQDKPRCEVCGNIAVDIHHIYGRGKNHDVIENLVRLCRKCHRAAHNEEPGMELTKSDLVFAHRLYIVEHRSDYMFRTDKLKEVLKQL